MGKTASLANIGSIADSSLGFRNRIINGAMVINQRATTITASGFSVDRWSISNTANSVISTLQDTSAPAGFINSLKTTITTAQTAGTGNCSVIQTIEGLNVADLAWGTASAATVALSFWVQCSSTGTFGGSLRNSGSARSYPFSYTISAANTWEQKTITIAGDTSGTWLTTNGLGIELRFSLFAATSAQQAAGAWYAGSATGATGQTQLASTVNSTFYITGVQLEKGSTATSFDYRPYGTELALCQRYFYKNLAGTVYQSFGAGVANTTSGASVNINNPVVMRATPTLSYGGSLAMYNGAFTAITAVGASYAGALTYLWQPTTANTLTLYGAYLLVANNDSTAFIALSVEL
jgi:hypothetical protein